MSNESLQSERDRLKDENDILKKTINGYETVLKLNEVEIENLETINSMYESMLEYSRTEMLDAKQTMKASEMVRDLSREELIKAFDKIQSLEKQNQEHKKKREETNKSIKK